jgi:HEAT repeat protein
MAPRSDRTRDEIDALREVQSLGPDEARDVLSSSLLSPSNLVVARAAEIVGNIEIRELADELIRTYERMAEDPFERDKGCLAMKATLGALSALEADAGDVYLHAVHHVQFDNGTFAGDPVDSAAELRSAAAQALVKTEHPQALEEIAPLLFDETSVRMAAARALRAASSHSATLLLRMSLLKGEKDPEVCFECFSGLLDFSGDSMGYVASFLGHEDVTVASMAALAIGDYGAPEALEVLKAAWHEQTNPDLREAILNAIASIRSDDAMDFLIGLVAGETMSAIGALGVLSRFSADVSLAERVRDAAETGNRRPVISTFQALFK